MFLLNSRLASFAATRLAAGRTSPISYVQLSLPSSLRIVLPIAFVYSTRPPVSVCGTVKLFPFTDLFLEIEILLRTPLKLSVETIQYRNFDLLSIGYANWPGLRTD